MATTLTALGLLQAAPAPVRACDANHSHFVELLGTTQTQVVFLSVTADSYRPCEGASRAMALYELWLADPRGVWSRHRITVASPRLAASAIPKATHERYLKRSRARARRLPGFVPAQVTPSFDCEKSRCGDLLQLTTQNRKRVFRNRRSKTAWQTWPAVTPLHSPARRAITQHWVVHGNQEVARQHAAGRGWSLVGVKQVPGIGDRSFLLATIEIPLDDDSVARATVVLPVP